MTIQTKVSKTFRALIYIGGDYAQALETCRQFCDVGHCVTVEKCDFVYTGGQEAGVVVGLASYPRFPKEDGVLMDNARDLARMLIQQLHQRTALIVTDACTEWLERTDIGAR